MKTKIRTALSPMMSGPKHDNIGTMSRVKRATGVEQRYTEENKKGFALAKGAIETAGVINRALALSRGWTPNKVLEVKAAVARRRALNRKTSTVGDTTSTNKNLYTH